MRSAVAMAPSGRFVASSTFDYARGVGVVAMGASLTMSGFAPQTDTWRLDGPNWALEDASSSLPKRLYSQLVYDQARRKSVIFGGLNTGGAAFSDTWQWDGTAWQLLLMPENPQPRGSHTTFPANDGRGIVIFGGQHQPSAAPLTYADTWQLRYESSSPLEQCRLNVDEDGDGLSGCADPDCWARCTPLCPPGTASCDAAASRCGDGTCNAALESCRNCPGDCATCTAACGDGFCDAPETMASCPGDCTQ
jgi:hypothetical protein